MESTTYLGSTVLYCTKGDLIDINIDTGVRGVKESTRVVASGKARKKGEKLMSCKDTGAREAAWARVEK